MEKDRDGCPKIVNLGSAKTDLWYERKKYGFKKRWESLYICEYIINFKIRLVNLIKFNEFWYISILNLSDNILTILSISLGEFFTLLRYSTQFLIAESCESLVHDVIFGWVLNEDSNNVFLKNVRSNDTHFSSVYQKAI